MERFSFASDVAFVPRGDLLDRVTVAPLTPSILERSLMQAAIFRVSPGGGVLRHPATYPQILAVLDGSGTVSGAEGSEEPIAAGEAVYWHEGEEHETRSALGLTALIIEGERLDRFRQRPAADAVATVVRVAHVGELERLERELLDALSRSDLDAAATLLHDEFLITTAGWIAEPVTKQTWLDSLAERMTLTSFDLRLLATRRFGDVAVVLAESGQTGTHDGAPFSLTFRYTDVWVRGDTGWALATRHASIVPAR